MANQTDALTRRAERSRNHLTELVDSLQNQITPVELVSQLVGRPGGNSTGPGLTEMLSAQISRNPLACMLIAAGIGWLMISERADKTRPARRRRTAVGQRPAVKRRRHRKKITA
jgi:hypothetical protein